MTFDLVFTTVAGQQLAALEADNSHKKRLKAVRKALGLLQMNPRYPGLNAHKYQSLQGPAGEEVFEVYAENRTPAAYRIFWLYGPGLGTITIIAITPHP